MHNFRYGYLLMQGPVLRNNSFKIVESVLKVVLNVAKYMLIGLLFFLDLPVDVSFFMVIITVLVDNKPYNGTFVSSTWYDMFKMAIHVLLMTLSWPLFLRLGVSVKTSVCIYVVLSFLEHIPKGCPFQEAEERKTVFMYHDISAIVGYMTAKYVFGFHSFKVVAFISFNTLIHIYLMAFICSTLVSFIVNVYLNMKESAVLHHNFLRKFGKQKISCYIFITLIKLSCALVVAPLFFYILYQELLFLHGKTGWKQTLDFLDAKTFSDKLDIVNMKTYSYSVSNKVERYYQDEAFTKVSISMETSHSNARKSQVKKAILGENVLLSIKRKQSFRNKNVVFVWSVNGKPIRDESRRTTKYVSFVGESGTKNNYMLIITRIDSQDFRTYCLLRQIYYNKSNCRNSLVYYKTENIMHNITFVTRTIACIFLVQYSERVKIQGGLGDFVKLVNIKVILHEQEMQSMFYSKSFMENKYSCPCSPLVGVFTRTGYVKEIRQISDSWSEVTLNISFCICPRAYEFETQMVFVSMWALYAVPTNVYVSVEPRPTDLFKQTYVAEFIQCEKLGFNLQTFFDCLRIFYGIKNTFQNAISREFYIIVLMENSLFIVTFVVILLVIVPVFICLDRLLFYIFHGKRKIYNGEIQQIMPSIEYDIYLSYNDESSVDTCFAEEIIKPFLKDSLGYCICDCENISPGYNRRLAFEENIIKSKTLIILLSIDYLDNDICMRLEYEYTLLSLLGAAQISKDDILIIKTDTCPQDARPLMQFTVIDWSNTVTNIRTESEKRKELKTWLNRRFREPGKLKRFIFDFMLYPVRRRIDLII